MKRALPSSRFACPEPRLPRRRVWLAILCVELAGCAVGPNFSRPQTAVHDYLPQPLASTGLANSADIPGDWWTAFGSPALNDLVHQALAHNPNLQAARAALRQAEETAKAQRGAYFPSIQAQYSASRQRNPVETLSPTLSSGASVFTLHTAQVSVSYLFDVFGLNRRLTESAFAQADAQRYQTEAAYMSVVTNVVTAAITEASLREQIAATERIIDSQRNASRILQRQLELGSIARSDLLAQDAALAATEATLPPLRSQLEQQRHLLSVLTGVLPENEPPQRFELRDLQWPQQIPLSVPSQLVDHRPDVLAAEAQLHAASAQVGVAIANLLPQITLTANEGGTSTQFSQLFASGNTFWSAGAGLTQTLFQGGQLVHRKRAADAALDQAGDQYRAVVLSAFQDVADALTALDADAQALEAQSRAEQAAAQLSTTIKRNLELGSVSYLALLNAEQAYQQATLGLIQARANRYTACAALIQALGGGWWNRHD